MKRPRGELRLHRGRIPAIGDARRRWSERSGLLLRLVDEDGTEGFGEASPLPGYSPDTLEDARRDLDAWLDAPLGAPFDASLEDGEIASPAARCALETATLDLDARRRGAPLETILGERVGSEPVDELPLAGLLPFGVSDEAALKRAGALVEKGYGTLKVKVASEDDRLGLLREIRRRWDVGLRLDANRSWPKEAVRRRLEAYAELDPPPEFVEEPTVFRAPEEAVEAMEESPIPLALDETLHRLEPREAEPWLACDAVRVVVLKPTLLGLERTLEIGRRARALNVGVVLSHAFEGPLAREMAAGVALVLADGAFAQGLGAHAGLDAWPRWESPRLCDPRIVAADLAGLGSVGDLWESVG